MWFNTGIFRSLGMAIVHSIWQGALIAVLVLFLLALTGKKHTRLRYTIYFAGLQMLLLSFAITFLVTFQRNGMPVNTTWDTSHSFSQLFMIDELATMQSGASGIFERFIAWLAGYLEPAYPVFALLWILGFLFTGIRMMGGIYYNRMIIRRNVIAPGPDLLRIFERLGDIFGISKHVILRLSSRMISPMVTGIFKPMIIIPLAAVSGLSTAQLEAILAHELAHIRRYDHLLLILQNVANHVLFFHPLAWYLSKGINCERENCCDDMVMKYMKNPIHYIKALAMIQEMNLSTPLTVNALAARSKGLLNRILRLIHPELKYSPAFRLTIVFLFLAVIGIATIVLTSARGNPETNFNSNSFQPYTLSGLDPDTTNNTGLKGIVEKDISDNKQGGQKKKLRIVFEADSVKEITVDGKAVPPSEFKEYKGEIREIREDMQKSQQALRKAKEELDAAREQLATARRNYQDALRNTLDAEQADRRAEIEEAKARARMEMERYWNEHRKEVEEQLRNVPDEIKEQMKKFREQDWEKYREQMDQFREQDWEKYREQMDQFRKKYQDEYQKQMKKFKEQDWEKFREDMRRSREDMRRAIEELRKACPDSLPLDVYLDIAPPIPVIPEVFPPLPPLPPLPKIEPFPPLESFRNLRVIKEPDFPAEILEEELSDPGELTPPSEAPVDVLRDLEETQE